MKRKFIDHRDWKRIEKGERIVLDTYQERFGGYASALFVEKVTKKLEFEMEGHSLCILDDGYTWVQRFKPEHYWALSTMFDDKGRIIEWYFDVTLKNGVDEEGRPFYDDLYLDVVVLPSGEALLLDEDELQEAVDHGVITRDDFDLAYRVAGELTRGIAKDVAALTEMSNADLAYFQSLRRDAGKR